MKKQVLFIQGGGAGAYTADKMLADHLQMTLGDDYHVVYPLMPGENAPVYEKWKAEIAKALTALEGVVILVGHSLGASFLLKFLSEASIEKPIAGVFLLATPYWGAEEWEVKEYQLRDGSASRTLQATPMLFYHNYDDDIVPFSHIARYSSQLPQAVFREFNTGGHQFDDDLSSVAADIRRTL